MKDGDFLRWIAARLVNRYGEHPNTDFVMKLKNMADQVDELEKLLDKLENLRDPTRRVV